MPGFGSGVKTQSISDTLVASSAKTTTGNTSVFNGYGAGKTIRAQLDVTAVAGVTPTLDVFIEDTLDGVNFNVLGAFSQKTAVSREVLNITVPFSDNLRVRWTIGGASPSFTFSVIAFVETN